ncbi:hypothetical protein E2C01_057083 [Portunus trituberculatus]|uniref:Secreted protein n=1 Tax=Portunus trituberculatus TaxID=210409 RepID=A0A5B7GS24_PORTR|nr:hypothetical protein [Portunus trituberculatus]
MWRLVFVNCWALPVSLLPNPVCLPLPLLPPPHPRPTVSRAPSGEGRWEGGVGRGVPSGLKLIKVREENEQKGRDKNV